MHLRIKPFNALIKDMYNGHGHFHEGDAGIDLFIIEEQIIEPGVTARIHLGIACENLDNKPYLLMPRSSISKTPLRQCNSIGLIDAGYRGEIMLKFTKSNNQYAIGERVGQIIILPYPQIEFEEVNELPETIRGSRGFGSTGK